MKISVIIPMYNSEKTIEECMDSLIGQTIFKDIELIIIDDCSNDSSCERVMKYEEKYPDNIMLICLDENKGPGNARNVALQYASGEYIGFVDSDDAVCSTMYEKLYNEAVRTGADYVDSGFFDQKNDRAIVFVSDDLAGKLNNRKRSDLIVVGGYICTKLFRKEFLDLYGIRFRNEYVLEDLDFLIECTARADKVATVKELMYIYRNSEGSLSKSAASLKYIHNQTSAMKAVYDRMSKLENYEDIREALEFVMLTLYSNVLNVCTNLIYLKQQPREEIIQMLTSLKKLKDEVVRGDYNSEYIHKGINEVNLKIIEANDISPEKVLSLLKKS